MLLLCFVPFKVFPFFRIILFIYYNIKIIIVQVGVVNLFIVITNYESQNKNLIFRLAHA